MEKISFENIENLAKTKQTAIKTMYACLVILNQESSGELEKNILFTKIPEIIDLNEYELGRYEKTGYLRWGSILEFYSINLKVSGFLEKPRTGVWKITESGKEYLKKTNPIELFDYVSKSYRDWSKQNIKEDTDVDVVEQNIESVIDPIGAMESGYKKHKQRIAEELLELIKSKVTPAGFERLILKLMVSMHYADNEKTSFVTGGTGDRGVDGVVNEDALGLSKIYLQAKKWEGNVGDQEVTHFIGRLSASGVNKGVLITTSDFTPNARDTIKNTSHIKVALINGYDLAELMIKYNLGVSDGTPYVVKEIDNDFFDYI